MSCKEAADLLHLSARTVEHYVERLKLRFGKRTLHGLLVYIASSLVANL
jgi:DNA-binding CsgD family transcriptional regulator